MDPLQDPVTYAIPFFLLLIGLEVFLSVKDSLGTYELKDSMANISMGIGSSIIEILTKTLAFLAFEFLHQFALFPQLEWQWWVWVLCFFLEDFSFYWHHRLSHEIRFLWASHINHHSSQKFNLSVALRQSWGERFYKYFFWLWLPLLGFEPLMVMTLLSTNLIYQFWVHTEKIDRLGPLEWIFNTPSHHRVHHAVNPIYLDRNHAGTLIIWDRMFGTFQQELPEEKPIYGITENIDTYHPWQIAWHEYVNIFRELKQPLSWRQKLNLMLRPPGWDPKGNHKTARALRERFRSKESTAVSE
ncbi:MAG: sterol desaturase family protein [Bacteroidota bacterium]